ncbi:MAG: hypothetical protein BWX77_00501 [Bacteroidetes bacterium ADurb.Bin090]|nr:MAG: hypothetical protein BWX77_00501 [Bacteroidetes bacterium ADurb.Bin090]
MLSFVRIVFYFCAYFNKGSFGIYPRSADTHSPVFYVNFIRYYKPNMPVDTRTGVPTAVFLIGIIHADRNNIFLTRFEVRC